MPVSTLLAEVEAGLGQIADVGYASAAAVEDAYEALVWWHLVQAAEKVGWTRSLRNPSGAVSNHFVFRTGPGRIYSSGPFTYAQLDHDDWPSLEVHLGIMIDGRSGVGHEFDVVALTKDEADAARAQKRNPPWSAVAVHAECKFYAGKVGLGLARGLWGLSADCRLRRRGGLVTNGPECESAASLLGHHGVFYRPLALPFSTSQLDMTLQQRLRWWLKDGGWI
jgi:hypothetical protein